MSADLVLWRDVPEGARITTALLEDEILAMQPSEYRQMLVARLPRLRDPSRQCPAAVHSDFIRTLYQPCAIVTGGELCARHAKRGTWALGPARRRKELRRRLRLKRDRFDYDWDLQDLVELGVNPA